MDDRVWGSEGHRRLIQYWIKAANDGDEVDAFGPNFLLNENAFATQNIRAEMEHELASIIFDIENGRQE